MEEVKLKSTTNNEADEQEYENEKEEAEIFNSEMSNVKESFTDLRSYLTKEKVEGISTANFNSFVKRKMNIFGRRFKASLKVSDFTSIGIIESTEYLPLWKDKTTLKGVLPKLKESGFVFWRRVSGDGNCFYRGVLLQYLEHLLLEWKVGKKFYLVFLRDFIETMFQDSYDTEIVDATVFLLCILKELEKTDYSECLKLLYCTFSQVKEVEEFLIYWLRTKLANFLCKNIELEIGGQKIIDTIPNLDEGSDKNEKIREYVLESLLKMDEFAEDYPIQITPIVLGVNINVHNVSKGVGKAPSLSLSCIEFSSDDSNFKKGVYYPDALASNIKQMNSETSLSISLLLCDAHYDLLYNEKTCMSLSSDLPQEVLLCYDPSFNYSDYVTSVHKALEGLQTRSNEIKERVDKEDNKLELSDEINTRIERYSSASYQAVKNKVTGFLRDNKLLNSVDSEVETKTILSTKNNRGGASIKDYDIALRMEGELKSDLEVDTELEKSKEESKKGNTWSRPVMKVSYSISPEKQSFSRTVFKESLKSHNFGKAKPNTETQNKGQNDNVFSTPLKLDLNYKQSLNSEDLSLSDIKVKEHGIIKHSNIKDFLNELDESKRTIDFGTLTCLSCEKEVAYTRIIQFEQKCCHQVCVTCFEKLFHERISILLKKSNNSSINLRSVTLKENVTRTMVNLISILEKSTNKKNTDFRFDCLLYNDCKVTFDKKTLSKILDSYYAMEFEGANRDRNRSRLDSFMSSSCIELTESKSPKKRLEPAKTSKSISIENAKEISSDIICHKCSKEKKFKLKHGCIVCKECTITTVYKDNQENVPLKPVHITPTGVKFMETKCQDINCNKVIELEDKISLFGSEKVNEVLRIFNKDL